MLTYNDLYELVRKEKYAEQLQPLPKNLLQEFSLYIAEKNKSNTNETDLFTEAIAKSKKQFENALSLFKELLVRRKKKLLNLLFVATETGLMKRDYENMLAHERNTFEKLVKSLEEYDREVAAIVNNKHEKKPENKLVLLKQAVDQFIDPEGVPIGPFKAGELVNIKTEIANVLITANKATALEE